MEQDSSRRKTQLGHGYDDGGDDIWSAPGLQVQSGKRMYRPLKTYQDRMIYYLTLNQDDWTSRTEQARERWDAI